MWRDACIHTWPLDLDIRVNALEKFIDSIGSEKPLAVVLGVDINGLGVVRSLAREDVPVICVDTDLDKPTMRTRYGFKYRVTSLSGEELIRDLNKLSESLKTPAVLFITEEDTVRTVSGRRGELSSLYRINLPTPTLLDELMHKATLQAHAEQLRIPAPKTIHVNDRLGLEGAADLRFPVILKPSVKDGAYSEKFKKAYLVNDYKALYDLYVEIEPVLMDMVVQEWIEGDDSQIYFCLQYIDRTGHVLASFPGRKLRSWPPNTGGTASCTVASEEEEVLTYQTTHYFLSLGFTGMCSMEYKYDNRRNQFVMIEPTVGRTDFQEEIATLNGINIPFIAYLSEVGKSVPEAKLSGRAVIWRETALDRWAAELQPCQLSRNLTSRKAYDAYWRISDPMPGLLNFAKRIKRIIINQYARNIATRKQRWLVSR